MLLFPGGKPELDGKGGDGSGGGEGGASEKARVAGGIMQEADSVLAELVRLREWKEEMENTWVLGGGGVAAALCEVAE